MKYRIQIQQVFGGNWTTMEEAVQHAEWLEKDNIKPRSRTAALEALETQMALYKNGAPHRVVAYYADGTFEVLYTLSRGTPWFPQPVEAEEPVAELLDIDAHFAACQGKPTPLPRLEHLRAERQALREAVEDMGHTLGQLKELKILAEMYDMQQGQAKYDQACAALVAWEETNLAELEGLEANHYWGARHYEAGGALLHGCPHPEGSDAAQAWATGWKDAQEVNWAPIYAAARKF